MAYVRIHNKGDYRYEERAANAAITPGMLVKVNSSNKVLAHDSSAGAFERIFAMEDSLQGNEVSDAYAANETVCLLIGYPGTVVNALCNAGTSYTVGLAVESNGDGTLKSGTTNIVGYVETAVDLSDSACDDALVPIRLV